MSVAVLFYVFVIFHFFKEKNRLTTLLCCVQSKIVRVIKSRRMRWAGHVAREGEEWGGV